MMINDMALVQRVPVPSVLQAGAVAVIDLVSAPAFDDNGIPLLYSSDYLEQGIQFRPIVSTTVYRPSLALNSQIVLFIPVIGRKEIHVLMDFENINVSPRLYQLSDFDLRIGGTQRALPLSFIEKPQYGPLQMHIFWRIEILPGESNSTLQVVFQNRIGGMSHIVMESR